MVRTQRRNVTVRDGTSKKYWYTIMGYVAALPLMLIYLAVTMNEFGPAAIMSASIFIIVLLFLGVASMPALFKDSAYLRESRAHWMPEWWNYIGASVGVPTVVYFGLDAVGVQEAAPFTMIAFLVVTYAASAYYIYNRHRFVGVP